MHFPQLEVSAASNEPAAAQGELSRASEEAPTDVNPGSGSSGLPREALGTSRSKSHGIGLHVCSSTSTKVLCAEKGSNSA